VAAYRKAVLFYNEKAGQIDNEQRLWKIQEFFRTQKIDLQIEYVPQPQNIMRGLMDQAIDEGTDLFLAAGGDGTVSLVGDILANTKYSLGIIPLGTGNLLAKQLKIPLNLKNALKFVISPDTDTFEIDTFSFNDRIFLLNLSVGVSSQIMEITPSEEKKRLGFFAYLLHFFQQILGLELHRFDIEIDGQQKTVHASEVMITNSRTIALDSLEWSEDVNIDDGELDLFVVRAANLLDILGFVISVFTKRTWRNPIVHHFKIKNYCHIETTHPLPIQADGDPVGYTPLKVILHPMSLKITVPKRDNHKNFVKNKERNKNERI
jgi:diacylglycerol kinase (ATP)